MSFGVEIYRCEDTLTRVETRPLAEVLRSALTPMFHRDLSRAHFGLLLHQVPEPGPILEQPRVENLMPEYGYATVLMVEDEVLTYRHPHPVHELIGRPLHDEKRAAHSRDVAPEGRRRNDIWGYRIVGPGVPEFLSRPTPTVESAVAVGPYLRGEGPGFRIRRVPDPDPPAATLSKFGVDGGIDGGDGDFVKVLVRKDIEHELLEAQQFSDEVEEGGFLVGRVFGDAEHGGTFLVEVTGALGARHTGASLLHFTFTGDSFQDVKRQLRERRGEQLLGWYHTHLFPATDEMGLSTVDFDLHFTTFRKPWQLAGLINLERDGGRTLRFYVRRQTDMALCPTWVVDAEPHLSPSGDVSHSSPSGRTPPASPEENP